MLTSTNLTQDILLKGLHIFIIVQVGRIYLTVILSLVMFSFIVVTCSFIM